VSGYLKLSEAVCRLKAGMFGNLPAPKDVKDARKIYPGTSIGSGTWRTRAAGRMRQAATRGDLPVYVISKSTGEAVRIPVCVVQRMISPRNTLPDEVTRPSWTLVQELPTDEGGRLFALLNAGFLVVREREFLKWYRIQWAKRTWPSQKSAKPHRRTGRPRKQGRSLEIAIWALVNSGDWSPDQPVTRLSRMLAKRYPNKPLSDETVARCVDALYEETADPRLRRLRVRRVHRRK
jgi:hypothetical protein